MWQIYPIEKKYCWKWTVIYKNNVNGSFDILNAVMLEFMASQNEDKIENHSEVWCMLEHILLHIVTFGSER